MKPLFHTHPVNGTRGDPALFIERYRTPTKQRYRTPTKQGKYGTSTKEFPRASCQRRFRIRNTDSVASINPRCAKGASVGIRW